MTPELPTDFLPERRAFLAGAGTALVATAGSAAAQPSRPSIGEPTQPMLTPQQFGAVGDGRDDDSAAIERALSAALDSGKPLVVPPGIYRITRPLVARPPRALVHAPRFSVGPRIIGAGAGATQFLASFGNAPLFEIGVGTGRGNDFAAVQGTLLEGFTIRSDGGAAGIRLHAAYNAVLRDLHLVGLSGNGVEIVCRAGDTDGSNMVQLDQLRIEICTGWGIDAAAAPGFNEISFLRLNQVFVQGCGSADGTGGGMQWKGQNCAIDQCAFVLNHNVGLLVPGGAGLAQTLDLRNTTFENNFGRHFLSTGISALKGRNLQFYSHDEAQTSVGCELDGSRHTVRFVDIDGVVVRAAAGNAPHTAFRISGTHAERDRCRVRNVIWENFDHPRQARFDGFLFDHAAQCCALQIVSPTEAVLMPAPDGRGNRTPLRLGGATSATGEWIETSLLGRVLLLNTGLRPGRTYHVYLYDDRNVKRLEASPEIPVVDGQSGYWVKPDNASRLYVGSVRTDPSGQFAAAAQ